MHIDNCEFWVVLPEENGGAIPEIKLRVNFVDLGDEVSSLNFKKRKWKGNEDRKRIRVCVAKPAHEHTRASLIDIRNDVEVDTVVSKMSPLSQQLTQGAHALADFLTEKLGQTVNVEIRQLKAAPRKKVTPRERQIRESYANIGR